MQPPILEQLYFKYLAQDEEMEQTRTLSLEESPGGSGNPTYDESQERHPYNFESLHGAIQSLQNSVEHRFSSLDGQFLNMNARMDQLHESVRNSDERMERMQESMDNMRQEWSTHSSKMDRTLDDMTTVAEQQFEVLYHRQMMMQLELDKCNKMAVYYHSDSGPPKPTPTSAQLAGYRIPNLSMDFVSGAIHELPAGVTAMPSLPPLPTFGRIPSMPPTPEIIPNSEYMPAVRIPLIASGQPLQGPVIGPFHYVPQSSGGSAFVSAAFGSSSSSLSGAPSFVSAALDGQSFSTAAAFGSPSSSAPSSFSQGVSPP